MKVHFTRCTFVVYTVIRHKCTMLRRKQILVNLLLVAGLCIILKFTPKNDLGRQRSIHFFLSPWWYWLINWYLIKTSLLTKLVSQFFSQMEKCYQMNFSGQNFLDSLWCKLMTQAIRWTGSQKHAALNQMLKYIIEMHWVLYIREKLWINASFVFFIQIESNVNQCFL